MVPNSIIILNITKTFSFYFPMRVINITDTFTPLFSGQDNVC